MAEWKFTDPPNLACFSRVQIMSGAKPILYVAHDEDGYWQFLDGSIALSDESIVIGLSEIVEYDDSISNLADLPRGWCASRKSVDADWQRSPKDKG